jgi:DNA-binding response OmpR family regulator
MLQANGVGHTLSNAVNESESLVDAGERLLEAGHVFLDGVLDLLVAAVDRVPAFVERIHALAQCRFDILLLDVVLVDVDGLCMAQRGACLRHGVRGC